MVHGILLLLLELKFDENGMISKLAKERLLTGTCVYDVLSKIGAYNYNMILIFN